MGQAKRKKKFAPIFKVGDWVRVDPNGPRPEFHQPIMGKVFVITGMVYQAIHEQNPSPWEIKGIEHEYNIFEEDVILDPFMTAAAHAVEDSDGKSVPKKAGAKNAA